MRGLQRDVRGQGRSLLLLVMMLVAPLPSLAGAASLSWGAVSVVQAPQGFSYAIAEVMFPEPRTFSIGAGVTRRLDVVQVVVRGAGFRPKATGPIIWLNGTPTLRTKVADDGTKVEAYFSHEGASEVY